METESTIWCCDEENTRNCLPLPVSLALRALLTHPSETPGFRLPPIRTRRRTEGRRNTATFTEAPLNGLTLATFPEIPPTGQGLGGWDTHSRRRASVAILRPMATCIPRQAPDVYCLTTPPSLKHEPHPKRNKLQIRAPSGHVRAPVPRDRTWGRPQSMHLCARHPTCERLRGCV